MMLVRKPANQHRPEHQAVALLVDVPAAAERPEPRPTAVAADDPVAVADRLGARVRPEGLPACRRRKPMSGQSLKSRETDRLRDRKSSGRCCPGGLASAANGVDLEVVSRVRAQHHQHRLRILVRRSDQALARMYRQVEDATGSSRRGEAGPNQGQDDRHEHHRLARGRQRSELLTSKLRLQGCEATRRARRCRAWRRDPSASDPRVRDGRAPGPRLGGAPRRAGWPAPSRGRAQGLGCATTNLPSLPPRRADAPRLERAS